MLIKGKTLLRAAATVVTTVLTMSAFAGGPTAEPMPAVDNSVSGFTLGSSLATYNSNTSYAVLVGYINDQFLADFGVGYGSVTVPVGTAHRTNLRADLGLRYQLMQQLFVTYGAFGQYGVLSNNTGSIQSPYTVGPFVGLDYQPLKNLLMSFKIAPYAYSRDATIANTSTNGVFTDGSLAVSYIFAM